MKTKRQIFRNRKQKTEFKKQLLNSKKLNKMKTTVKTIAAGLILTASVFGVNAKENLLNRNVADYKLKLESWMMEVDNFNSEKAEVATSKFLNVSEYELELESWMSDVDKFNSERAMYAANNFLNVADHKLNLESWMFDIDNFNSEKSETSVGTVVDIAVSNSDFSILVEAVTKAGLAGALSAEGPFTVFAPTNDAFKALFKQLGVSGVKDLTAEQLTPILTYHVVAGKVMSTDLSNTSVATLNGQKIKIDLSNGVKINESNVTTADISGINGVVHVIDRVLLPK
jgi:transforming growth factor-beta-induced protein